MKLLDLYNVNKWPRSLPLYKLKIGEDFRSQWINDVGFCKHYYTKTRMSNGTHIVLPIKKRKK